MMKRALLLLAAAACGAPSFPAPRFANAPPVATVDDREDVPARPGARIFMHDVYHYDGTFQRRIARALELPRDQRARGVNAIDEVPDSTWFTNRIGVRTLTPDEIRAAPGGVGTPEGHAPWTIKSTKTGDATIGFIVKDARGEKWLIKFDWTGFPEVESGAHVIVDRLLWACGYNVTEDYVVYVRRDELRLDKDAVIKDVYGDETPLDEQELDRRLSHVQRQPDGSYRALASRWLDGKPLGGHPAEGVREDDPNDLIPHQLRRDLRGAYSIFAWLDHVDVQEGNFLDMWIEDPRDPSHHYVKHYLLDFGRSLGVMATIGANPRHGEEYVIDFVDIGFSAVTFGLFDHGWEDRTQPAIRGVGMYDVLHYDPAAWKPDSPAYLPFLAADRIDKFWGAKILARFDRDQIHAAVEAARFSDPRATEYLTDAIVARQRVTAAYWFGQVNPLDRFTIEGDRALCFDDLTLLYGYGAEPTRYAITRFDFDGRAQGEPFGAAPDGAGHTCTPPLALAAGHDGYTIVRIDTHRADFTGTTYVHLARDPATGATRVIGVWRP